MPKGQTSEDIFDPPEEIMPAWAVNLTKMHEELAKDVRRKSSGSAERTSRHTMRTRRIEHQFHA